VQGTGCRELGAGNWVQGTEKLKDLETESHKIFLGLALKEQYMNNLRCNRRKSYYNDYKLQRSAI
jgi:hypothetical protein